MKIRIKKAKDYQQILKTMKGIGSETHDLKNIDLAWVVSVDSREVGLVGIRSLNSDYVVIDSGPAADVKLSRDEQLEINKKLLGKVMDYVQGKTKAIYSMNAEEGIEFLESVGFKPIDEAKAPKGFSHPCLVCSRKGKSCFPKLTLLKLK